MTIYVAQMVNTTHAKEMKDILSVLRHTAKTDYESCQDISTM